MTGPKKAGRSALRPERSHDLKCLEYARRFLMVRTVEIPLDIIIF